MQAFHSNNLALRKAMYMPTKLTRRTLLAMLALPAAGCSLQPLAPLRRTRLNLLRLPAVRAAALGQRWTYKVLNAYNSEVLDNIEETVSAIEPEVTISRRSLHRGALASEIHSVWGQVRQDPLWAMVQTYDTALPQWPEPLTLGANWKIDTPYRADSASYRNWINVHSRLAAYEQVSTEAGVFETARIERFIRLNHPDSHRLNYTRTETLWLAPALGRWVVRETDGEYWTAGHRPTQRREDRLRWELQSWV